MWRDIAIFELDVLDICWTKGSLLKIRCWTEFWPFMAWSTKVPESVDSYFDFVFREGVKITWNTTKSSENHKPCKNKKFDIEVGKTINDETFFVLKKC